MIFDVAGIVNALSPPPPAVQPPALPRRSLELRHGDYEFSVDLVGELTAVPPQVYSRTGGRGKWSESQKTHTCASWPASNARIGAPLGVQMHTYLGIATLETMRLSWRLHGKVAARRAPESRFGVSGFRVWGFRGV